MGNTRNLYSENRRHDLLDCLDRLSIPYQTVWVDNYTVTPEIDVDGPIITNGSIMLSKIAVQRGWVPGSLLNENFSYDIWQPIFEKWLLNKDAVVSTIGEATIPLAGAFIRPVLDDKSFNGKVYSRAEFDKMQKCSLAGEKTYPKPDTRIIIAPVKIIGQEHRHYIVNGKIITSSRYKLGQKPNFHEGCDDIVLEFVKRMIGIWQPADAFVLDTYISGDEIGIVEMGCICNAGLYQADLMKLVIALDEI